MANVIEITDLNDPALAHYTGLTQAQLRSRLEPEKGVFIAESPKVIRLALAAGCRPISFLMERKHITGQAADLLAQFPDAPVYTADREVLARLTGYELTRGILCALPRPALPDAADICKNARRIAVLENIVDSTNLGAIFRSAAALGVDAILVSPGCCDVLLRRCVRVSMGTVFQVPWTVLGSKETWPAALDTLHALGFATAAMALTDDSVSMDDPALRSAEKLAIILGTEGTGLLPETIQKATYTVKIPMSHKVDSLNVAAAAAVAFWETRLR